jgi:hypothetical protein
MNYIDGIDMGFDTAESQDEAAAAHQMALDSLYRIGCQYSINMADSALLCQLANIDFNELKNHSTNSTESTTSCLSQQCSLVNLVPEKQPAFAI